MLPKVSVLNKKNYRHETMQHANVLKTFPAKVSFFSENNQVILNLPGASLIFYVLVASSRTEDKKSHFADFFWKVDWVFVPYSEIR